MLLCGKSGCVEQTSDEAVFRQAVASVLAGSAPPGAFDVEEPRRFKEATSQSGDSEKQGEVRFVFVHVLYLLEL